MADTKISQELPAGPLDGTELAEIVQSGNNRKTTTQAIANLAAALTGPVLDATALVASRTEAGAMRTAALPCSATFGINGGAGQYTLTPMVGAITSLHDGMRFRFLSPVTSAQGINQATVIGTSNGLLTIMGSDGFSFTSFYDLPAGSPITLEYQAANNVFAIVSPPSGANTFAGAAYSHGRAKLQAASGTELSLTSNDGGSILCFNQTTGGLRLVPLGPGGINQQLFNGTANVEGVANQSLLADTLYSVYLKNNTGNNVFDCSLTFWRTTSGFNPTLDEYGNYILNSGGPNPVYMYVGMIYTGTSDITNNIGTAAAMGCPVCSHFNPWVFGYQTTVIDVSGFSTASLTTQITPSILFVTEGIENCSTFFAQAVVQCDTPGAVLQMRLKISGTAFNDTPWTSYSTIVSKTCTAANAYEVLYCKWNTAPPMGVFTAQLDISCSAGTSTWQLDILGNVYQ